jgi:hypothetical protein
MASESGPFSRIDTSTVPRCFLSLLAAILLCRPAIAAPLNLAPPAFAGSQSCMSSSCHGGGVGKDQGIIWAKKDPHSRAEAVLATARSARIAEALKIPDPKVSARCTVCHSPMETLPAERLSLLKNFEPEKGVSCESCHGASEPWLRFHTRPDVSHAQRVAAGLRELTDLYARANACVACHLNLDAEIATAGRHPEMFFELDGQMAAQPPHYKDDGAWIGPRAWQTGQAVALREMSWKLSLQKDEALVSRWKALVWLLRKSGPLEVVPNTPSFSAAQFAADRLAKQSAHSIWSSEKTLQLLRTYSAASAEFRDPAVSAEELRRRGEVLVMAVDRLWSALKTEGGVKSDNFDSALRVLVDLARAQVGFDQRLFAAALEQLEVALERLPQK